MSARRRVAVVLAAVLLPLGCTQVPSSSTLSQGELLLEMTQAIEGLRDENVYLQVQIDSLREAVARQDTLLTRLVSQNGLVMPAR